MPGREHLTQRIKAVIDETVKWMDTHWKPSLGYGWTSVPDAQRELMKAMGSDADPLQRFSLEQWGVQGPRIQGSEFAFIGIWVSMLNYYFDTYFSDNEPLSKPTLDRQILWSQQSVELGKDNPINKIFLEKSRDERYQELKTLFKKGKQDFKSASWTSVMNMAGPGAKTLYTIGGPNVQKKDQVAYLKDKKSAMENYDSFTDVLNMGWLEDLFTRQSVPIILFNSLNLDELSAVKRAVRWRDYLINVDYDSLTEAVEQRPGGITPRNTIFVLLRELLLEFYDQLNRVTKRKFINLSNGGVKRITQNQGTIPRILAAKDAYACASISGLLKLAKPDVKLTGTGKEFFFLLAKGASAFICGETLILSRTADKAELAAKLASISSHLKRSLLLHFHPSGDQKYYRGLTKDTTSISVPFADPKATAKTIEAALFLVNEVAVSYEPLFG